METIIPKHQKSIVKRDYRNPTIFVLFLLLALLGAYIIYDKNRSSTIIKNQENQITSVIEEKSDVQKSFDASLARLDSMTGINTNLNSELIKKNDDIEKMKVEIRTILNKNNASSVEIKRAKDLISKLNNNISLLKQDVDRLTAENKSLTNDKIALTADKEKLISDLVSTTIIKQDLEEKVNISSTLNASNITVTPINIKNNGKEKISTTAKRINKLKIGFDVDNRIAPSGKVDIYVLVVDPNGKTIETGTFTTREEGEKSFTAKLSIDIETNKKKNVEFNFSGNFKVGNYTIQIYQNGFLIGQKTQTLKKGGLFS